ncbi:MAG: hypothetical protein GX444_03210 [Myxococcales bacterium]|nr:hypothetical protein [Myxococcales bacterium]
MTPMEERQPPREHPPAVWRRVLIAILTIAASIWGIQTFPLFYQTDPPEAISWILFILFFFILVGLNRWLIKSWLRGAPSVYLFLSVCPFSLIFIGYLIYLHPFWAVLYFPLLVSAVIARILLQRREKPLPNLLFLITLFHSLFFTLLSLVYYPVFSQVSDRKTFDATMPNDIAKQAGVKVIGYLEAKDREKSLRYVNGLSGQYYLDEDVALYALPPGNLYLLPRRQSQFDRIDLTTMEISKWQLPGFAAFYAPDRQQPNLLHLATVGSVEQPAELMTIDLAAWKIVRRSPLYQVRNGLRINKRFYVNGYCDDEQIHVLDFYHGLTSFTKDLALVRQREFDARLLLTTLFWMPGERVVYAANYLFLYRYDEALLAMRQRRLLPNVSQVAGLPERNELYVGSLGKTIAVLDSRTLKTKRTIEIGYWTSRFAVDPTRLWLYATACGGSELLAFDLETTKRLGSVKIFPGAKVVYFNALMDKIFVGGPYGLVQVSPEAFSVP